VDVLGLDHLRRALRQGDGVLIVSNHAANADPYVLLTAGDLLGCPFYYPVAWQLLVIYGRLGRWALRHHGCFSLNREGNSLAAWRPVVWQ
jgi:1-acyl-sn-glycerol-3-phosphate acyltransferase